MVARNTLFDAEFYLSRYADAAAAGVNPLEHYRTFGWREGRDPNAYFSTTGYLAINLDVAAAGVDPLEHYLTFGWREGRDPSGHFDVERYLAANPAVADAALEPLNHFIEQGRTAFPAIGHSISNGFDRDYYLWHNTDVAAAGVDALEHYRTFGWREGRAPNAYFDTEGYLAANPDVAAAGFDPLEHYVTFGWREGRDPSAAFDTRTYLAFYVDVAATYIDPLQHFLRFGIYEGRLSFADGSFVDLPVFASGETYRASEDTPVRFDATVGLLANDRASEGGPFLVAGTFATEAGGSIIVSVDGSFTYTPATDFNGTDRYAYAVRDADGSEATTVTVFEVASSTDVPVLTGSNLSLPGGTEARTVRLDVTGSFGDAATVQVQWLWGDGEVSTGTLSPTAGGRSFSVTASHHYAAPGARSEAFAPTVRLLDAGGVLVAASSQAVEFAPDVVESFNVQRIGATNLDFLGIRPAFSANGRYLAFVGDASAFLPGQTFTSQEVLRRDLQTGAVDRVVADSTGNLPSFSNSRGADISSDGRYVVFTSRATGLTANDSGNWEDVFRKDLLTGEILRASESSSGSEGGFHSFDPAISADGRYIVFNSAASNLTAGPAQLIGYDTFRKDLVTGEVVRVGTTASGTLANAYSLSPPGAPDVSADGRYVVFESAATNLTGSPDGNSSVDLFRKDLNTGAIVVVTASTSGILSDAGGQDAKASADGRFVVFSSRSVNLIAGDTNDAADIFRKDLTTGEVIRVSASATGVQADSGSSDAAVSADGRFVVFSSDATNLVEGDTNGVADIFRKDLLTGEFLRLSVSFSGAQADRKSMLPAITADGRVVAFASDATNLTTDSPADFSEDLFLVDTAAAAGNGGFALVGGVTRDALVGGSGADTITGGAGDQALRGNGGADRFEFSPGHGRDVVADFDPSDGDVLVLVGFGPSLDSASDVLAAARQAGPDVLLLTGPDSSITLRDFPLGSVSDDVFAFA
ncbi:Ig-like domain-containing protein [Roseomonas sp. WA12]